MMRIRSIGMVGPMLIVLSPGYCVLPVPQVAMEASYQQARSNNKPWIGRHHLHVRLHLPAAGRRHGFHERSTGGSHRRLARLE